MKSKKKADEEKYIVVKRLTARGMRTLYIPRKEYEKQQKRIHTRLRGRIIIDGKLKQLAPEHILWGPAHKDINPKAPADWTPENNKEFTKKWT